MSKNSHFRLTSALKGIVSLTVKTISGDTAMVTASFLGCVIALAFATFTGYFWMGHISFVRVRNELLSPSFQFAVEKKLKQNP